MASPVVAGVAAVIRAYFPKLKAKEVKEILTNTVTPIPGKVIRPGDMEKVEGAELSRSGGLVNAYEAFRLAELKSSGRKNSDQKHPQLKGRA
jgi:subtilisin family serine protease